jgi:hypothetical protein
MSGLAPRVEPNWQPAEATNAEPPRIAQASPDPLLGAAPSAPGRPYAKQLPSGPPTLSVPGPSAPGAPSAPAAPSAPPAPPAPSAPSDPPPPSAPAPSAPAPSAPSGPVASATPGAPSTPKLYPPEVVESKTTGEPPLAEKSQSASSPPAAGKKSRASFPAGIAQFYTTMITGVSTGVHPKVDDGLDWLADHDYKTVVRLRAAAEEEGPDRKLIEDRYRMRYISFEISPEAVGKSKLDEFAKIVGDTSLHKMFVYDQDGSLAAPLWYLYFRKINNNDDGVARILSHMPPTDTLSGQQKRMWDAVQQYLSANP